MHHEQLLNLGGMVVTNDSSDISRLSGPWYEHHGGHLEAHICYGQGYECMYLAYHHRSLRALLGIIAQYT